jgi:hypothetical protein
MKTLEHRKTLRRPCHVPVEGQRGGAFDDICSVDISHSGIGFVSQSKLPLYQKIAVEVELGPGQDPVVMMGEVKWVTQIGSTKNYRIGMKFIKVLSSGSRSRLTRFFEEK